MPKIVPRIQNFTSYFIGGDPYTYASVGAAESITLPLSTSFFYISNAPSAAVGSVGQEGYVAPVDGDLTVNIPDAEVLGTTLILSATLSASPSTNDITFNFTGINDTLDSIKFDNGSYDPYFQSLIWTGSYWQLVSKPIIQ